ncbi:hypothetical protein LTR53_015183, partial [Teratosphaeriaceae sp. CCFEE 6253]
MDAAAWRPERWLGDPPVTSHMLAYGSASCSCPGEDLHYALIVKLLVQILPNIDLDMAATTFSASSAAYDFGMIKEHTLVKICLPKTTTVKPPPSPLRAIAASFAPETTTAPMLPPGLTPHKVNFDFSKIPHTGYATGFQLITGRCQDRLAREAAAAAATTNDTAAAPTSDTTKRAVSPTLSVTSSNDAEKTFTFKDQKTLGRLIRRRDAEMLMGRFDPKQDFSDHQAMSTRSMPSNNNRKELHGLLERIYGERLEHRVDMRTNRITIKPTSKVHQQRRDRAAKLSASLRGPISQLDTTAQAELEAKKIAAFAIQ